MDIEMTLLVNFPLDKELNLSFKIQTVSFVVDVIGVWKKMEKRDLEWLTQVFTGIPWGGVRSRYDSLTPSTFFPQRWFSLLTCAAPHSPPKFIICL